MANILDILRKTIEEVQSKNQKDPKVETADPSIFDLLRKEVNKLDNKVKTGQAQKGKRNPKSILDMIKDGIEGVRKDNRKNPKVATAPKSVFEDLLKKVGQKQQRQASTGLKKVVEDYNLDIRGLSRETLVEVQNRYQEDLKKFNHQYATALFNIIKQQRRR
ncbi:MAG: hypothetical protein HKO66_03955 [Saprospiraceae bacterium]|nr:hypothetical protein [Bacteroidia bacterium]NNL91365.1 hypothetical protein [Saprospiraceae bacterium]